MTTKDWRRYFGLREAGVYYALLLLMAIIALVTASSSGANYFSAANLTNILYQASLVGMMGVAMTVILITGNFDLSVASVAALSGAVLISLAGALGFWPAAAVAMLIAIGVGLLNGAIVQLLGINAFIVTLGTLTAIRGLVLIVTNSRSLMVDDPVVKAQMVAFEGGRAPIHATLLVIGAALIVGAAYAIIRRRSGGPAGLAIGGAV